MVTIVKENLNKINDACKRHHVKKLYLFGSAARSIDFDNKSDIDLLVEFNYSDETNDENVFERVKNMDLLKSTLMQIMNRELDLIQEKNINNRFLKYFINKDKKLIYGVS